MHDEKFMRAALREAARGVGHTSPNPAVGAVIVRGGRIVARGFHRRAGAPHAEIEALGELKNPAMARGATLCVTLEPCSTHGRTPPCVDAIIRAGFARVVIGTLDPNPAHAGRGVGLLRAAGLAVTAGVLESACRELNAGFNQWIVTGRPLVIAKAGLSLDGRLTVRGVPGALQPWRIIVTRSGDLPAKSHVFTDAHRDRTLVFRGKSLRAVLHELGRREVTSVLIEGGGRVLGDAFDRRLVDRVHFYLAPLLCGGPVPAIGGRGVGSTKEAPHLRNPRYEKIGSALRLTAEVEYPDLK